MSGESTEFEKHFTQLEKYVTEINVVQVSLDETQTVECPGVRAELVVIVYATDTYKRLKDRLAAVHTQLSDRFAGNQKTWDERDFGKLKGDN